jgi:hypothetical protein
MAKSAPTGLDERRGDHDGLGRMVEGLLLLAGSLAPIVYAAAVVYGASARPDYSHIADPISKLIEAGASNKALLDALFIAYNGLLIIFAAGLVRRFVGSGRAFPTGSLALGLTGILGLVMAFFPMDPIGAPATIPGITHIVLAGLESFATVAAVLAFAIGFARTGRRGAAVYSYLTLAAVLVSGGIAAWSAAAAAPAMGLWERLTIGGALQWIFAVAVMLLRERRRSP